ncbi:unnamed protein product [Caenorhabditis angaria]|uniref:Uncharacterized protein n=1 Tax=Caenorhabditis angaria TaxID=860376 RepID=A0A9P1N1K4_9PELO|nr:unnamed protein product [Caenorhabditis angaria]
MIKLSIFLIIIPIVFSSPIQPSQNNSIIGYQFLNTLLNAAKTDDYSIFNETFEGTYYVNDELIRNLKKAFLSFDVTILAENKYRLDAMKKQHIPHSSTIPPVYTPDQIIGYQFFEEFVINIPKEYVLKELDLSRRGRTFEKAFPLPQTRFIVIRNNGRAEKLEIYQTNKFGYMSWKATILSENSYKLDVFNNVFIMKDQHHSMATSKPVQTGKYH